MRYGYVVFSFFLAAVAVAELAANDASVIAVVLACHRSSHLKKTLRSFAKNTPPKLANKVSVYVSVDEHPKSYRAIRAAKGEPNVQEVWHHVPSPEYAVETTRDRIARHYHFALSKAFDSPEHANVSHVIVLEDDLTFSPDFLPYMLAATKHLSNSDDNSVVCASAWNDNGRNGGGPKNASLTTFFPGLGWVLSRSLWSDFLRPHWPGSPTAHKHGIVGIGWDFWLRVAFEAHGWACIIPSVPRVFHFGATGSNVAAVETEEFFATSPLASVSPGDVDWEAVLINVTDVNANMNAVQERLREGHLVKSLDEAVEYSDRLPIMPYLRETFQELIANPLKLWPSPRGHFHHTLLVKVAAGKDLLLYDKRRAAKRFRLAMNEEDQPALHLHQARKNASCDEECRALGLHCTSPALEVANSCESLSAVMSDGCQVGCAYETGNDLPARVEDGAPLQTAGMCLIAETGAAENGSLDCEGKHQWTTRSCACVGALEGEIRDEL